MISQETVNMVVRFSTERDWDQFHSPANLAKSISIEAGELLECFQWDEDHYDKQAVTEELADVLAYCINLADKLNLDMDKIIQNKFRQNEKKYPVSKSKGTSKKYNRL